MIRFFRAAWLVTRKDLLIEVRSREILYTTLFFAVSCVLVFAFGFVDEGRALEGAAAGILWIAIAFSGTLALGRTFERERQSETLRALLMAPVDRPALYVGKLAGVLLLLAAVEAVIVPLVALMFQAPLFEHPRLMLGLLASGTIGFAAVGTLFAAMLGRVAQPRRPAAGAVVSDHDSGHHRRRARHRGAAAGRSRSSRWPASGCRCWCSSTSCSSRWRSGRSSR